LFSLLLASLLPTLGRGQAQPGAVAQTVRGTVRDAAASVPVIGATVVVVGLTPALGASTDAAGRLRLLGVAGGRLQLRVKAVGYEPLFVPEALVTSGKEVGLNLQLTASLPRLGEVQATYQRADDTSPFNPGPRGPGPTHDFTAQ